MKRSKPASRRFWGSVKRRHWLLGLLGAVVAALAVAAVLSLRASEPRFAAGEPVEIAVVFPDEQEGDDFLTGVRIATEQVNAQGGMLGHPVALRPFKEDNYTGASDLGDVVSKTMSLATRIGKSPSILAVIGHGSSATAVPASAVYNRHKKLFMATHATATSLSNLHFDMTFALQPNNADNANMLAAYAISRGLGRIIVLSDNSNYGIETTNQFRSLFSQDGGMVLLHARMTNSNHSIEDLLLYILDNEMFRPKEIDAFFITSSDMKETANFIQRTRQLGLNAPIIGPEHLYSQELEQFVGAKAMQGVVAISVFDQGRTTPEGELLAVPFEKATGRRPGLLAAMGFDALKALAYAANKAGSLDPEIIADTLRILRYDAPYIGATGPLVFDANGLITDTQAYVVQHDGAQFRTVATYRKPFIRGEGASGAPPLPLSDSERNPKP